MFVKSNQCIKCGEPCTKRICRKCFCKKGLKVTSRINVKYKKIKAKREK